MSNSNIGKLLCEPVKVVNIGLESFANELKQLNVDVVQVNWVPPAGGDVTLANLLSKLGS